MEDVTIPRTHPRYESLVTREKIVEGFKKGIVVPHGLIAHGRGEALDYILGEKTTEYAREAAEAAAALLTLSKKPVIAVNGNTAALVGRELITLSATLNAPLEVNLFHRSREREEKIRDYLTSLGASKVLLSSEEHVIEGISSARRFVSGAGIKTADTVVVAIEDGDRTEELVKEGKNVIAIDLNPLSRTAEKATITIVDNVIRAIPLLTKLCQSYREKPREELLDILKRFDNQENLRRALAAICQRLERLAYLDKV
ncbi:MAG TPA: phosphopantothenate/pantothenate synthetase [Aigarchaeota archaeon]|nr:phosphopantothenate/pantothenate synthetase [Aigarchaeota archaeon]